MTVFLYAVALAAVVAQADSSGVKVWKSSEIEKHGAALSKKLDALPLTRRYMVDAEDALRRKENSAVRAPVQLAGE